MTRTIFSGLQILHQDKWLTGYALVVEEKKIHSIIPSEMVAHHLPAKEYHFPDHHYLIPGLIDLHIHGVAGCDVMDGSEEALVTISHALAKEGVSGFLATTMSVENEQLEAVLKTISSLLSYADGAAILGAHLEGPFISKEKKGAHRAAVMQLPNIELIRKWQALTHPVIKRVTLAPELPGAIELIKKLCEMNVRVSIGHTHATYEETLLAIKAGAKEATHLFNAMRGLHQREPGAVSALLLSDVIAELIVDGLHLHPAIVELALRLKGKERLLLVTDAIRAKCLRDGQYDLGGQQVNVQKGEATLSDGTIAGSLLRMPDAVKNMMQFTKCSLIDAINMASYNPACALQIETRKGSIAVGKDADLVVMNPDLQVLLTMREGKVVFSDG